MENHKYHVYFVKLKADEHVTKQVNTLLYERLHALFFTWKQKAGRIGLNVLLRLLSSHLEIAFVNIIKKKTTHPVFLSPKAFFIGALIEKQKMMFEPAYPGGKHFYIGLTFDIDYKQDYDLLPMFLEDLRKYDFSATINLVTHADYAISSAFIREMQQSGFEIGLHGDTHNTALAFLPKRIIRWKLQRAIDKLGFLPSGYRRWSRCLKSVL